MKNQCVVCGYQWHQRLVKKSRHCPQCNSARWDRESLNRVYNFGTVEINEHKIILWIFGQNGLPDSREGNKVLNALKNYEKRTGRKFRREGTIKGLLITRIV